MLLKFVRILLLSCLLLASFVPLSSGYASPASPFRTTLAATAPLNCLVLDGLFSTCPNSSAEWGSVPFTAYPATNAYLYAAQADLDPALQTPTTPVDSFGVLFDFCGAVQPLAPDQYAVVQFRNVKTPSLAEKYRSYVAYIFGDGTLTVFIDGVAQVDATGQVRVAELDGQRGKVGFGKSPNCAFDHVIVEFKLVLERASDTSGANPYTHTLSPDPLLWTGQVPDAPPCDPVAGRPQLLTAMANPMSEVELGASYRFISQVSLAPKCQPTDVALQVAVTGGAATTQTKTLPPGETTSFVFDGYQHTRDWAALFGQCTGLEGVIGAGPGNLRELLTQFGDGFATVGGDPSTQLAALNAALASPSSFVTLEENYSYQLSMNGGGASDSRSLSMKVHVPTYQREALLSYLAAQMSGTVFGAAGIGLAGGASVEPLAALSAILLDLSCRSHDSFTSYDSFYTELILGPPPISVPSINALPDSTGKQLALTYLDIIANHIAMSQSLRRYEGAKLANARGWMILHLQQAQGFLTTIRTAAIEVEALTAQLVADLAGAAESLDLGQVATSLTANGLPTLTQDVLTQRGYTSAEIAAFTQTAIRLLTHLQPTWKPQLGNAAGLLRTIYGEADAYITERLTRFDLKMREGFTQNVLPQTDDGTTGLVPLGFSLTFYGKPYDSLYINNNGNVTFDAPLSQFTPDALPTTQRVILAPFFADVDTRLSNPVRYGTGTVDGRPAFGVTWPGVGCYNRTFTVLNTFQVILIDRADTGPGNFDFEFNYDSIQWEAGQSSGGSAQCQGGSTARVGHSDGSGLPGTFYELPGSGVAGAYLDSNLETGLIFSRLNSSLPGRYSFPVRNGLVNAAADDDTDGIPNSLDNCPFTVNPDQRDSNANGVGDLCETAGFSHQIAGLLQAQFDGFSAATGVGLTAGAFPSFVDQLVWVGRFRIDSGLVIDPEPLVRSLVGSLVETGQVPDAQAEPMIQEILARLRGDTPGVGIGPRIVAGLVEIAHQVDKSLVLPGETVTWTVTVTNISSQVLTSVDIDHRFTGDALIIRANNAANAGSPATYAGTLAGFGIESLQPGQSARVWTVTRVIGGQTSGQIGTRPTGRARLTAARVIIGNACVRSAQDPVERCAQVQTTIVRGLPITGGRQRQ